MTVANDPAAWNKRGRKAKTPWEAALWSEHGQNTRFMAVLKHVRPQPAHTLLDFGCGVGRFSTFLPQDVSYTGVDWATAMLERATEEAPRGTYYEQVPGWKFDHVVAIGAFNLVDRWSKDKTWAQLHRLWEKNVKRTLVVSLLRKEVPGHLAYDPLEAVVFARTRTGQFELDCSYLENDMLLVMRK